MVFSAIFAVLTGAVLFVTGIYSNLRVRNFDKKALRADGTIAGVEQGYNGEKSGYFYPVVEFRTNNAVNIRFKGGVGATATSWQVGQPVTVLYNPDSPRDAKLKSNSPTWLAGSFLALSGVVFLAVGIAILIWLA